MEPRQLMGRSSRLAPRPSRMHKSRATMGLTGSTVRRPQQGTSLHLRGSLLRNDNGGEWSATADPSPAGTQHEHPALPTGGQDLLDASNSATPASAVHMSEIMRVIHEKYDLNVAEADHFEWLLGSGLLPTIGHVWDACETLRFPRKSSMPSPATPAARAQPPPTSWTQGEAISPPQRPERFNFFTQSPAHGPPPLQPIAQEPDSPVRPTASGSQPESQTGTAQPR